MGRYGFWFWKLVLHYVDWSCLRQWRRRQRPPRASVVSASMYIQEGYRLRLRIAIAAAAAAAAIASIWRRGHLPLSATLYAVGTARRVDVMLWSGWRVLHRRWVNTVGRTGVSSDRFLLGFAPSRNRSKYQNIHDFLAHNRWSRFLGFGDRWKSHIADGWNNWSY